MDPLGLLSLGTNLHVRVSALVASVADLMEYSLVCHGSLCVSKCVHLVSVMRGILLSRRISDHVNREVQATASRALSPLNVRMQNAWCNLKTAKFKLFMERGLSPTEDPSYTRYDWWAIY